MQLNLGDRVNPSPQLLVEYYMFIDLNLFGGFRIDARHVDPIAFSFEGLFSQVESFPSFPDVQRKDT